MSCKGSERACLDCIWKARRKPNLKVRTYLWAREMCSKQVRGDPYLTSLSSMIIWTLTPPQNRTFLWNLVHSWIEWMIDCERCWNVLQKIQCKTLINVLWFWWMFMSSTVEASVFMGKNYSDNLHSIRNTRANLTLKQMFGDSCTVDIGTISWDFWSVSNQLGKFSKETVISGQWWRSHQPLACKGLCILRFCVMLWKGESEPNIKILLGNDSFIGSKIHHNTELWTQLTENRWNSSGIFPQDSLHCSSSKKSKSSWTKWANLNEFRVDVQ